MDKTNQGGSETDIHSFLDDLDAGTFATKMGRVISDVAAAVCDHDQSGKVTVELTLKRVGSGIVNISHKLAYVRPTMHGKQGEEATTSTPMHVNRGGKLTFMPENQRHLFEDKE